MAVRIRLTRVGATKQPSYRVVVADSRSARDSRSIETLGHYNPRKDPVEFEVDADKAKAWIAKGALPSDTVARLFRNAGVLPADSGPRFMVADKSKAASAGKAAKADKPKAEKPEAAPRVAAEPAGAAEPAEAAETADGADASEPEGAAVTAEKEAAK
jgi:small subunit ribosomal protein S16